MKALVVEDDTLMRKMLVKIISGQFSDIQIVECENGQRGMEEYDSGEKYDFAIIDFEMPKANGLEVVTYIRKERGDKNIPLLMCTSRNDKKTVVSLLQAGASDYIAKPFEPENVINKIERIIKRAERLRALRASVRKQAVAAAPATDIPAESKSAEPVEPDSSPDHGHAEASEQKTPVEDVSGGDTEAADDRGMDESSDKGQEEEAPEETAKASVRHGNIGDDIIDDTDDEQVFVDITAVDEDSDAVEISEDEFL